MSLGAGWWAGAGRGYRQGPISCARQPPRATPTGTTWSSLRAFTTEMPSPAMSMSHSPMSYGHAARGRGPRLLRPRRVVRPKPHPTHAHPHPIRPRDTPGYPTPTPPHLQNPPRCPRSGSGTPDRDRGPRRPRPPEPEPAGQPESEVGVASSRRPEAERPPAGCWLLGSTGPTPAGSWQQAAGAGAAGGGGRWVYHSVSGIY
jgi:hypothetical protein